MNSQSSIRSGEESIQQSETAGDWQNMNKKQENEDLIVSSGDFTVQPPVLCILTRQFSVDEGGDNLGCQGTRGLSEAYYKIQMLCQSRST